MGSDRHRETGFGSSLKKSVWLAAFPQHPPSDFPLETGGTSGPAQSMQKAQRRARHPHGRSSGTETLPSPSFWQTRALSLLGGRGGAPERQEHRDPARNQARGGSCATAQGAGAKGLDSREGRPSWRGHTDVGISLSHRGNHSRKERPCRARMDRTAPPRPPSPGAGHSPSGFARRLPNRACLGLLANHLSPGMRKSCCPPSALVHPPSLPLGPMSP